MDKRLEQIKEVFEKIYEEKDSVCVLGLDDDDDWHSVDVLQEVNFSIDQDRLCVSFYSNCRPTAAAIYIQELYSHGITDFEIYEATFVIYNEEKEEAETFFGEEAEHKYLECVVDSFLSSLSEEKGESKCH